MRALAIAAMIAMAAAGALASAASAQERQDWRLDITEADWTFVGEGKGVVSLARSHPTDARLIEFRYEYEDDSFSRRAPRLVEAMPIYAQARSSTSTVEIDCEGGRRRPLEEILYAGRNLSGGALLRRVENRPWATVEPGTVGFDQVAWACSARRPF